MSDELLRRTPPHDLEAERAALGAILLDNRALDVVAERVSPADFYSPAHSVIFRAAIELRDARDPVDTVSLVRALERADQLKNVGGAAAVSALTSVVPSSANAEYYARAIRETSDLRRMLTALAESQRRIFEDRDKPGELLDAVERSVYDAAHRPGSTKARRVSDVVREAFDLATARRGGHCLGIPTGFARLDYLTRGLHAGDLVIVAARPSVGKSTFAANVFRNVVAPRGSTSRHGAIFFSLEMSAVSLVENLLCSLANPRVDTYRLRSGYLSDAEEGTLMDAASFLEGDGTPGASERILFDDSAGLTLLELRAKARRLRAEGKIDFVVVDYVQLLTLDRDRRPGAQKRHEEVAEISRGLKALARELEISVLAIAQLNRGVEDRPDHRPRMSDLKESGALEQDADVVLLLHREDYYLTAEQLEREENQTKKNRATLIVAKNRHGPVGEVELFYAKEFSLFADLGSSPRSLVSAEA